MTWRALDAGGCDLGTGSPPRWPGSGDPAAAVAAAPVMTWPMVVAGSDGSRTGLARALGPGGDRVEQIIDRLMSGNGAVDVASLAHATPAGLVHAPSEIVNLRAAAEAAERVDAAWLAGADAARAAARAAVLAAGRAGQLEAGLHATLLLASARLDPAGDRDADAHAASGGQLWLLAGAVASALAGLEPDPFGPWARLVTAGWWPVGPVGGRLVVGRVA